MVKAILFDFRGTLVDTSEAINNATLFLYRSVRGKRSDLSAAAFSHFLQRSRNEVKEKFGRNITIHNWALLVFSNLFSKLAVSIEGQEFQDLMQGYENAFVEKVTLFSEVEPILKFLKMQNLKLGVVIDGTSKRERAVISKLRLENYLDVVIISEEVGSNKFSLVPLQKALEQLELEPSEVMVVGDRIDKDIAPANALGCISVKINRLQLSMPTGEQLLPPEQRPAHVIAKLNELANFI